MVPKSRATENTRRQRVKDIEQGIQRDEEDNEKGDGESCGGVSVCKVHREKTSGVG